jgi:hypothetical protein
MAYTKVPPQVSGEFNVTKEVFGQINDAVYQLRTCILYPEDYGAIADSYYADGTLTDATTLVSPSAGFTSNDVGKYVVLERAGNASFRPLHALVASFVNSTTVTLSVSATLRAAWTDGGKGKFLISRGGDSTTPIQTALDDGGVRGGAIVYLRGPGYLFSGFTLRNRTFLVGPGMKGCTLHMMNSINGHGIVNDVSDANNSAEFCGVIGLTVDMNRANNTAGKTTTLTAGYTAGGLTFTVASTANFRPNGYVVVNGHRYQYFGKTATTLPGLVENYEATTTPGTESNGSTVIQYPTAIHFTPDTGPTAPLYAEKFDPHYLVRDVIMRNCKGDGFENIGQSESRIENCHVDDVDACGFRPSTDTWMRDCSAESCGRSGYFFRFSSTRAVSLKAFNNGTITQTDSAGFLLEGPSVLEEGTIALMGCEAQDNRGWGFWMLNRQRSLVTCTTSSNSQISAGTYGGMNFSGVASQCIVDLISTTRNYSGGTNDAQKNALAIAATCVSNKFRISHGSSTSGTVTTALQAGSDVSGGNEININGMGGSKTDTFAASYTPDPYTGTTHKMILTANVTAVNAPSNAHQGCKLKLILQQDGTGGRTLPAFNAIYKMLAAVTNTGNTLNKYWVAEFEYDGTNWLNTSLSQWVY